MYLSQRNFNKYAGAQPVMFQGRGGLVGLGHFYKHFDKNTRKKVPQGKIWELFLLDTLKTTFWMENLTQKWKQSGHFLQNQGTFFSIFKIGQGSLPPSHPPSCSPGMWSSGSSTINALFYFSSYYHSGKSA